ncbi:hypothetical protein [Kibdelosporangium persicum]|uniref:hypothetical protein n=1 Tax=Kibdelosporangium persicum TaxID=2698649 RepID=UPI001563BE3A|nr:hypothetical protein [Kibdelosporangium persicum]
MAGSAGIERAVRCGGLTVAVAELPLHPHGTFALGQCLGAVTVADTGPAEFIVDSRLPAFVRVDLEVLEPFGQGERLGRMDLRGVVVHQPSERATAPSAGP